MIFSVGANAAQMDSAQKKQVEGVVRDYLVQILRSLLNHAVLATKTNV